MRLAVTGISSYLARTLFPLLEADSSIEEIRGLDLKQPRFRSAKLRFIRADVRDPDLARHLKGCDALVHLAFIVMPIHDEAQADDINISGSRNVFQAASAAGVGKIVYSSSIAAYGAWPDNPAVITEETPVRGMPNFYYSRAKAAVELFLNEFAKAHPDLVITRLRPCIFVGPTVENAVISLVRAKVVPRFIGRNTLLQLVWDEDVAQAVYLALKNNFHGAFNLAGDGPINVQELAKILDRPCLPLPFGLALGAAKLAWPLHLSGRLSPGWIECMRDAIVVSSEKAKRVMGWKPTYDTTGALRRLMETLPKA